ncbi:VOC family protein [Streptomyces sp. NPDC002520]
MLQLKRIDNMDILTRDVGRLVDFYHGVLGLGFHLPYAPEEEWAAIDLGNVTLYLFKSETGEHAPRRTEVNAQNAPGLDSFAFEVDDLDIAYAELDGRVEWVTDEEIVWKHPSGVWYRYRPFYDPDGNMLYVTEPHRAGAAGQHGAEA